MDLALLIIAILGLKDMVSMNVVCILAITTSVLSLINSIAKIMKDD